MNVFCGARKIEQLQDSARGAEITVEAEDVEMMKNSSIL